MKRVAASLLLAVSTSLALGPLAFAAVGTRAPEFSLPAAPGAAWRGRFRLAEHLGQRPVVVVFWATFCQPCTQELAYYQELYRQYGPQRLMVVGVATDGPDSVADVGPIARQLGITFPIVSDLDTTVLQQYNPANQVPFSVWINRQGVIVRERASFSLSERPVIQQQIARLVNNQPIQ